MLDIEKEVRVLREDVNRLHIQLMVERSITNVLARWVQQLSKLPLENVFDEASYPNLGRNMHEEDYLFELHSRYSEIREMLRTPVGGFDDGGKSST